MYHPPFSQTLPRVQRKPALIVLSQKSKRKYAEDFGIPKLYSRVKTQKPCAYHGELVPGFNWVLEGIANLHLMDRRLNDGSQESLWASAFVIELSWRCKS